MARSDLLLRSIALGTWLLLLTTALVFAPAADPGTNELILRMMTGQLDGINQSLFALFNLMGVFPLALLSLLAFDSREQRVWKWPFILGSFVLGAFALLPYLVLRRWQLERRPADALWLRFLGHRVWAAVLLVAASVLTLIFFFSGDLSAFVSMWRTNQFAFVMSFDFVACCIAGALLCWEASRATGDRHWWVSLIPAIGVPLYLLTRHRD